MENLNSIKQELNELGIKLPHYMMPEMQVPQGYFDTFPSSILDQLKSDNFISSLPKEMLYQTPVGFFENFSTDILDSIHQKDFIASLPKTLPYQVPKNYFNEFPIQILAHIHRPEKALSSLTFSRKLVARLSLAATLLLFMGIAFKGLVFTSNTIVNNSTEQQLSNISDQDINQYIIEHQTEIESSLALETFDASNIDLQKFETEVLVNTLNNISDEELLNYAF